MTAVRPGAGANGFTLIEVLAAVALTAVVVGVAVASYINLSNASTLAVARTRDGRHATTVIDRIARDLEAAYLIAKPPEVDPLSHPWIFLAEAHLSSDGSDRLKFITLNHRRSGTQGHASDLALVAYVLREAADGEGLEIVRWTSSRLPEGLDRSFPETDDSGAMVLAERVSYFGVRFLSGDGEWVDAWDSSTLLESSSLPLAAEIELALADPDSDGDDDLFAFEKERERSFRRRVVLQLRPIDLQAMLAGTEADGDEGEEDEASGDDECTTVFACLARSENAALFQENKAIYDSVLEADPQGCWTDHFDPIPGCD